jgi:hypothetical protein
MVTLIVSILALVRCGLRSVDLMTGKQNGDLVDPVIGALIYFIAVRVRGI